MSTPHHPILDLLEDVHQGMDESQFSARCPAHDDKHASLSVRIEPNRVLLHCHAGCSTDAILEELGLTARDLFTEESLTGAPRPAWHAGGVTVEALADDKRLPAAFLKRLGLENLSGGDVRIPYGSRNGGPAPRHRIRRALRAGEGSSWERGSGPIVPYGLQRLARDGTPRSCLLVEGESDCWTAWHHELPALGIPGARMAGRLEPEDVSGFERFLLWQEPDAGGEAFVSGVASRLEAIGFSGEILVVRPESVKDLNDLHKHYANDRAGFRAAYDALVASAVPVDALFAGREAGATRAPGVPEALPVRHRTPQIPAERRLTTDLIGDEILKRDRFAVDAIGSLYRYERGVYRPLERRRLERQVIELTREWDRAKEWNSGKSREVNRWLEAHAETLWDRPPLDRLNLQNGILEIESGELMPHTPEFLSPIQLPVAHDPDATCPAWERFVSEAFPQDAHELAWEIAAWLMLPDTDLQRAILLYGEGGNGKSTFIAGLTAFLGQKHVSAASLQSLESDRFSVALLQGRLANFCPDLPSKPLRSASLFKSLTGGDTVQAERKYRDAFEFRSFARFVFSTNRPPRSDDTSLAFSDRWLVIPFERRFRGTKDVIPRGTLDAQLADSTELSGLLNKALCALPRLRRRGFSRCESLERATREFSESTNPIELWLPLHTVEEPRALVSKADLLRAYNQEASKSGRPPESAKSFSMALKRARPRVGEAQRTWKGQAKTWCWIGLGLRGERESEDGLEGDPAGRSQDSQGVSTCCESGRREGEEKREKEWGESCEPCEPCASFSPPRSSPHMSPRTGKPDPDDGDEGRWEDVL